MLSKNQQNVCVSLPVWLENWTELIESTSNPKTWKKTHFKHEKKLIQLQHSYIKRLKAIITPDSQNKNT